MSAGSGTSSAGGAGAWIGAAEVYDGAGRYAGIGSDERTVIADDDGRVTVDVTFDGPFQLAGRYTIDDHGDHRRARGPLNHGYTEVWGDGLVTANSYWADLGLSQRLLLTTVPDHSRQLSLAIISRGEERRWTIVGEFAKRGEADPPTRPEAALIGGGDPTTGRGEVLLHRPGRWRGELTIDDADGTTRTTSYAEAVSGGPDDLHVQLSGTGYTDDLGYDLATDGWSTWTPHGEISGSGSLSGGRARSTNLLFDREGLRCWQRDVVTTDGMIKAVVHTWYRGDERIGIAHGIAAFEPAAV